MPDGTAAGDCGRKPNRVACPRRLPAGVPGPEPCGAHRRACIHRGATVPHRKSGRRENRFRRVMPPPTSSRRKQSCPGGVVVRVVVAPAALVRLGHAGDTCIWLFRDNQVKLLTRDHVLPNPAQTPTSAPSASCRRSRRIFSRATCEGDVFALTSNGVHGALRQHRAHERPAGATKSAVDGRDTHRTRTQAAAKTDNRARLRGARRTSAAQAFGNGGINAGDAGPPDDRRYVWTAGASTSWCRKQSLPALPRG